MAYGAIATTRVPCVHRRLAQPQEDRRRLVLGLEAREDDGAGGLEVGVRHGGSGSTTSEARNDASSAESGRERKSMSLVPSAIRANLL